MFKRMLAIVMVGTMFAGGALAEDTVVWGRGEVRGWKTAVDRTIGNGCFIYSYFEGNSFLRLGVNPQTETVYMLLGDSDWQSITEDQEYQIELQMGRKSKWNASAIGGVLDGMPSLLVTATDLTFLRELSSQSNVRAWFGRNEIANISLRGSAAAIDEMIRCQNWMDKNGGDPFASATTTKDPFKK